MNRTPVKAYVHNFDAQINDHVLQLNVFLSPQQIKKLQRLEEETAAEKFRQEEFVREQHPQYQAPSSRQEQDYQGPNLETEDLKPDEIFEIKRLLKRMREGTANKENIHEETQKPITKPPMHYTDTYTPNVQSLSRPQNPQPIEHHSDYRVPLSRHEANEYANIPSRPVYTEMHQKPAPEPQNRFSEIPRPAHPPSTRHSVQLLPSINVAAGQDYPRSAYGPSNLPTPRRLQ